MGELKTSFRYFLGNAFYRVCVKITVPYVLFSARFGDWRTCPGDSCFNDSSACVFTRKFKTGPSRSFRESAVFFSSSLRLMVETCREIDVYAIFISRINPTLIREAPDKYDEKSNHSEATETCDPKSRVVCGKVLTRIEVDQLV